MINELLEYFFNFLIGLVGSSLLASLLLIIIFFIIFLIIGIPFEYTLILILPLTYGFYLIGWLPVWLMVLLIIFGLGFSVYFLWNKIYR